MVCVADENGFLKLFQTFPKFKSIKEISAQKSCIYDVEWLSAHQLASGGGDQYVSVHDVSTQSRVALLRGHTESVKSISKVPSNSFVIASGSRDGSILIFDTRCNRREECVSNEDTSSVSSIRSIGSIQRAHCMENRTANCLKSKTNHVASPSAAKRPCPVSCVLFQNENMLVSTGATDGLVKVWDIRKIHTYKRNAECQPVYMFDNHLSGKGYSSLAFNSNQTRLYSNCMNNLIYEHDFISYKHTRSINTHWKKPFNVNQSNFIKSCLSNCDNFLLTGSSDSNAYIYSTNLNAGNNEFKRLMPVIVLKGHTNEVTTVDWNPHDINQLITCSDDNTIRLWNVKRQLDELETKECNFLSAELVANESDEPSCIGNQEPANEPRPFTNDKDSKDSWNTFYSSNTHSSNLYTKYRPHSTGVYDDFLFMGFEFAKFARMRTMNLKKMALENELCSKWENINIDNLKMIESNLLNSTAKSKTVDTMASKFLDLSDNPLRNLPIFVLPNPDGEDSSENSKQSNQKENEGSKKEFFLFRRQSSSVFSSNNNNNNNTSKTINATTKSTRTAKSSKTSTSPKQSSSESMNHQTPIKQMIPNSSTKKRNMNTVLNEIKSGTPMQNVLSEVESAFSTPKSKRRLIMNDQSTNNCSPSRTILHYFSPKPPS